MPPRYAYWTILVDEQPTAFRAGDANDLQPTFKRLQQKHPSARMVWYQNGKVWNSRLEAQEAMRMRGERGRAGDARQREGGGFRERQRDRKEDRPRDFRRRETPPERRDSQGKLEWKPKGSLGPSEDSRPERPKLEWRPKGKASGTSGSRIPVPGSREKSRTGERRDKTWRPGGEHRDPRQKYKDAKKAKWTRFKKQIRTRWDAKQTRKKKDEE